MKYLEAKKIQTIIECLNNMNENTTYKCKVEHAYNENHYCYLYSNKDSGKEYADLILFANALECMIASFCTCIDRATIMVDNEYVNAIRCW